MSFLGVTSYISLAVHVFSHLLIVRAILLPQVSAEIIARHILTLLDMDGGGVNLQNCIKLVSGNVSSTISLTP